MRLRRGFALAATLWVVAAGSVLAGALVADARHRALAAGNRTSAIIGHWSASGCLRGILAQLDRQLNDRNREAQDDLWRAIDDSLHTWLLASQIGCLLDARAAGSTLDVNRASHAEVVTALTGQIASPELVADRLFDWIDSDDVARPLGAERGDYEAVGLPGPKNQSIVDVSEFDQVLGAPAAVLKNVLGVDSARIALSSAPGPVLASIPGFSTEAVGELLQDRSEGQDIRDLRVFAAGLSRYSSDQLIAAYPEIVRRVSLTPEWWCLGASVSTGVPVRAVRVAVRVARRGSAVAVVGSC